mgnify:FL=1
MNLENFIDIFKEFLFSEKNLSQNSINNYLVDLKQFLIFFNRNENLNENIENYISLLRKNNISNATINRKISPLKNFLNFLQPEKLI